MSPRIRIVHACKGASSSSLGDRFARSSGRHAFLLAGWVFYAAFISGERSALAAEAESSAPYVSAVEEAETSRARWMARAQEANDRVAKATAALAKAQADWERMRTRNYPRGEARAKLRDALDDATTELATAEEALVTLVEEARAADVPASWLDVDETAGNATTR